MHLLGRHRQEGFGLGISWALERGWRTLHKGTKRTGEKKIPGSLLHTPRYSHLMKKIFIYKHPFPFITVP